MAGLPKISSGEPRQGKGAPSPGQGMLVRAGFPPKNGRGGRTEDEEQGAATD